MPDFEMHDLDPCPMPSTLQAPAKRGLQPQSQRRYTGTAAGLISTILRITDGGGANGMNLRTKGPLTPRKLFIWIRSSLLVRMAAAYGEQAGSDDALAPVNAAKFLERFLWRWRLALRLQYDAPVRRSKSHCAVLRA
jgi:hypothetical protein